MESKIGLKFQTNLQKNILPPKDPANNVDNAGIITFLQLFPKIHGLFKNKISFLNFIDSKEISGKTYQNNSLAGKLIFLFRTDNDLKNHFYSTLRKSLRRLNKSLGEKNSTSQMR